MAGERVEDALRQPHQGAGRGDPPESQHRRADRDQARAFSCLGQRRPVLLRVQGGMRDSSGAARRDRTRCSALPHRARLHQGKRGDRRGKPADANGRHHRDCLQVRG